MLQSLIYENQWQKAFYLYNLISQKDIGTARHSLNVAFLSSELAKFSGELDTEKTFISGLLHDIGKIEMPDYFFGNKTMTRFEEINIIHQHPNYSKLILEGTLFDNEIVVAAYQHHERFDGSGYPLGISGKKITPIARLLGIVDSFYAMIENRPYKKPITSQMAIKQIIIDQNIYDTEMLNIFMQGVQMGKQVKTF